MEPTRAYPQEQNDHSQYDDQRLNDARGDAVDGMGHLFRLERHDVELVARWQAGAKLLQAICDRASIIECAFSFEHGDGEHNGWLAIEVGGAAGGILIAAADFSQVTQAQGFAAG